MLKKFVSAFIILSLSLSSQSPLGLAAAGEKTASLNLHIETSEKVYKLGDPLQFQIVLRNVGQEPLHLFQPDSLGKLWPEWKLEVTVTKPDGKIIILEPEITFQMLPQPLKEHYQTLAPAQEIRIPLLLLRPKAGDNPTTNIWVALIEITKAESQLFSPEVLKAKHHIKGDTYIISGAKEFLAIRDTVGDVFNAPGTYLLEARYDNHYNFFLSPDATGERLQGVHVPSAWHGTLLQKFSFDIVP